MDRQSLTGLTTKTIHLMTFGDPRFKRKLDSSTFCLTDFFTIFMINIVISFSDPPHCKKRLDRIKYSCSFMKTRLLCFWKRNFFPSWPDQLLVLFLLFLGDVSFSPVTRFSCKKFIRVKLCIGKYKIIIFWGEK